MLSSVLAAITCAVILVDEPLDAAAVLSDAEVRVAVGTHVTPTSFRARNFSPTDHLLVFAAEGAPEPVLVQLPPGGVVEYEFAPQALPGVKLEVVALGTSPLRSGGAHRLALPFGSPDMCLWTVPGIPTLATWRQDGVEVTLVKPTESLLPTGLVEPGTEGYSAPLHIPVAVPRTVLGPGQIEYTPM